MWHVANNIMKRPTVNPMSYKNKFKDNNCNNNEEALLDYDDGISLAMLKEFQASEYFPSEEDLESCLDQTGSHNTILLDKYKQWWSVLDKDCHFHFHYQFVNDLMPITRWYKESIRYGNGEAVEGVWLCPQLYSTLNKVKYRDETSQ